MNTTSFASLSLDSLTRVVGGYHDPGGSGGSGGSSSGGAPDDFGSQYVKTVQKDYHDSKAREGLMRSNLKKGNFGTAAKNGGYALLDELNMVGDILPPATAILGAKLK